MSVRRWLGMDGVDLLVHLAVTILALVMLMGVVEAEPEQVVFPGVMAVSVLLFAWRRRTGLRRLEESGATGETRLAELDARVLQLEAMQERLFELEERMDFAERLLAGQKDPERLGPIQ